MTPPAELSLWETTGPRVALAPGGRRRSPFREETDLRLSTFTADAAAALPGPGWLRAGRAAAFERLAGSELPTDAEEVWRYSRIGELDLEAYSPSAAPPGVLAGLPSELQAVVDCVPERAGLLVVHNGRVSHVELDQALAARGVVLAPIGAAASGGELLGSVAAPGDVFVDLNTAFMAEGTLVQVPAGVAVGGPILVVHWVDCDGGAVFPRLVVRTGEASQVTVLEQLASPSSVSAFVAPVVELDAADASNLALLGLQQLGPRVWQVGYQASRVGRDATLTSALVALGGHYARVRTDSRLAGQGGTSNLVAAYFGDSEQMHDFRTLQDHEGPKTMSDLLFKGAVQDHSHSVYSGLIRVRHGAAGTNAFQTNRNLVLAKGAHADSVPNLEIEENDVRCSHASAVGPVDEDQRYYLEARGVPPEVAERLIVLGFFDEVIDRTPIPGLRRPLRRALADKLHGPQPQAS
ncbi:MAG: Fe-S cluster assembly protein SufD [Actinomycetota bacterium]|nr:Fe-S cluster assembly protein SufD [Actinomycetota bacterium]